METRIISVNNGYVLMIRDFGHTCYLGKDGYYARSKEGANPFKNEYEAAKAQRKIDSEFNRNW